jgi:AcrR family transcriptional regulator
VSPASARAAPSRRYAKRLPREVRREQILDAALGLIAREGWAGMTMERVAADADIAKSVLYAVFGSQAGLQNELMRREHDRGFAVAAAAVASARGARDPLGAALGALDAFLAGVEREPDTWRIILSAIEGAPESVRAAISEGRERWRRELEPIASALLAGAGLAEIDAELVAHLARGNAEYLARLMLDDPDRFDRARFAAFTSDFLTRLLPR